MKHTTVFRDLVFVWGVLQGIVPGSAATDKLIDLPISAKTSESESDNSAVYQSSSNPLLLGNDGSAATGGFRVWSLNGFSPLTEVSSKATGRSKLATTVYDVGEKDLIITISQPNNVLQVFDINGFQDIKEAAKASIGDWSASCTWKSLKSGSQYFYIFGKKQVIQYLIRADKSYEIVEVSFQIQYQLSV